jgi:hypothetical protein
MAAGVWGRQPYHHHVPTVYKFWKPQPPTVQRAFQDLYWDSFTFTLLIIGHTLSLVATDTEKYSNLCEKIYSSMGKKNSCHLLIIP